MSINNNKSYTFFPNLQRKNPICTPFQSPTKHLLLSPLSRIFLFFPIFIEKILCWIILNSISDHKIVIEICIRMSRCLVKLGFSSNFNNNHLFTCLLIFLLHYSPNFITNNSNNSPIDSVILRLLLRLLNFSILLLNPQFISWILNTRLIANSKEVRLFFFIFYWTCMV